MKKINKIVISLGCLTTIITSCEPEFNQPLEDTPIAEDIVQSSGDADFSKFIALGASITAGYSDGALFIDGQDVAFPKLIAEQMQAAGGGTFTTPYMNDNIGGFAGVYEDEDNTIPTFASRFVYNFAAGVPERINNTPANDITASIAGNYSNIGIPGAKSFHALATGYGNLEAVTLGLANPYFARMATSSTASMLEDVTSQNPTFVSVWLGGNDILSYASYGGLGVYQDSPLVSPSEYGDQDITNPLQYQGIMQAVVSNLVAAGANGVVLNIPSVTDLPFFTAVNHDVIPMDAATATATNTAYEAYNAGLLAMQTNGFIDADEVEKRTINFEASTSNAVVITDESLTDLTAYGLPSMRQATSEDSMLLTASSIIGTLKDDTDPTSVYGVGEPLGDEFVLTADEQELVTMATESYNTILEDLVANYDGIMLFDANAIVSELKESGINYGEGMLYGVIGSAFSLDGIHLTPRGNAVFANKMIEAINDYFGSTLQDVDPTIYNTGTLK